MQAGREFGGLGLPRPAISHAGGLDGRRPSFRAAALGISVLWILAPAESVPLAAQAFEDGFEAGSICAWSNPWYPDQDGDGFGDALAEPLSVSCPAPDATVPDASDCDDTLASVHPLAAEVCGNGHDDDCDPSTPDIATTEYYPDCDGDGFASSTIGGQVSCTEPEFSPCGEGSGWTATRPFDAATIDCSDVNSDMFPGQELYFLVGHDPKASTDDERFGNYNCNQTADSNRVATSDFDASACTPFLAFERVSCPVGGWDGAQPPACGDSAWFTSCGGVEACPLGDDSVCTAFGYPTRLCTRGLCSYYRCGAAQFALEDNACR